MVSYKTGQKVGKGTYWDMSKGRRIDIEQESILSGDASSTYYRIPASIMLLAGPVIGLVYVICLPFIGIATIASLATGKVVSAAVSLIGKSLSFGWRPREAYFSGKKKSKKEPKQGNS